MKILFIGDVVGKPGLRILSKFIPLYKKENKYELICVNGENAAGGFGLTKKSALKMKKYGCDVITTGNHILDRKEEIEELLKLEHVLRPLNYEPTFPGKGFITIEVKGKKVSVINIQGQTFMPEKPKTLNPFEIIKNCVEKLGKVSPIIIVDIHAETTAEKIAMRYFLDGKISALVGTHTHVQTADEMITKKGTAYITDVGMTGAFESIIGMQSEPVIKKFMGKKDEAFKLAKEDVWMNAVEIEIDENSGKANSIRRIKIGENS
ncbi:MAG: TIGR00282 family metallophosphoesterase [candidate division WOR-3 bacterium]